MLSTDFRIKILFSNFTAKKGTWFTVVLNSFIHTVRSLFVCLSFLCFLLFYLYYLLAILLTLSTDFEIVCTYGIWTHDLLVTSPLSYEAIQFPNVNTSQLFSHKANTSFQKWNFLFYPVTPLASEILQFAQSLSFLSLIIHLFYLYRSTLRVP